MLSGLFCFEVGVVVSKRLDHGSQVVMKRYIVWWGLFHGLACTILQWTFPICILLILSILLSAFYFLLNFPQNPHNHPHNPSYLYPSLPHAVKPSSLGHPYKL